MAQNTEKMWKYFRKVIQRCERLLPPLAKMRCKHWIFTGGLIHLLSLRSENETFEVNYVFRWSERGRRGKRRDMGYTLLLSFSISDSPLVCCPKETQCTVQWGSSANAMAHTGRLWITVIQGQGGIFRTSWSETDRMQQSRKTDNDCHMTSWIFLEQSSLRSVSQEPKLILNANSAILKLSESSCTLITELKQILYVVAFKITMTVSTWNRNMTFIN